LEFLYYALVKYLTLFHENVNIKSFVLEIAPTISFGIVGKQKNLKT
jgi:hypothetical protein